jgi:hypothetical protein
MNMPMHHFAKAPRYDAAARSAWVRSQRHYPSYPPGVLHQPIEVYNFSDLGGAVVAPDDIFRICPAPRGWVRLWLAPRGARIECPLRLLMHRDQFRSVVWQQANARLCGLPSQGRWRAWISERLAARGISVRAQRPHPPRYHEAQDGEDDP